MRRTLRVLIMWGIVGGLGSGQALAQVQDGSTTGSMGQREGVIAFPVLQTEGGIDYVHARAMPLPTAPGRSAPEAHEDLITALTEQIMVGETGSEAGGTGNGSLNLVRLGVPRL